MNSITATTISGTIVVPFQAPTGSSGTDSVQPWTARITCQDQRDDSEHIPGTDHHVHYTAYGNQDSPVLFTLAGTNFEPAGASRRLEHR